MDAASALGLLRRRWLPLLLCVLAGVLGAVVVTKETPKTYRASTTLFINIPNAGSSAEALQGVQLSNQLLTSYAAIAGSRTAAGEVKERLGLAEPVDVVRSTLAAVPQPETQLLNISATTTNPRQAELVADAAAAVFLEAVRELEQGKSAKIDPSVVDSAVASSTPINPRPKVNLAIGLFIGMLTGTALALILEALDRSVKTPGQAEDAFGAPILAVVPRFSNASPLAAADQGSSAAGEAYRTLRTAVQFVRPDHPLRTILVTSASEAEGKTTTACNLAVALAQAGERVVLVDADLRRGRVVEVMGVPGGVGVTSVIMKMASLEDALIGWRELLAVLGPGPFPPNPSEILGSGAMVQILDELRRLADVVVIDCPPVLPVTDAVALATQVDGVVLVARAGVTERKAAAEARQRLDRVGATVVGCVLNGTTGARAGYYTGYQRVVPAKEPEATASVDELRGTPAEPHQQDDQPATSDHPMGSAEPR